MAKNRAIHKNDRKGIQRRLRDFLGISADTIQIAQFLGSVLKPVLAAALIGGTVVVVKTIIEEKTDFLKKDTSPEKVVIEHTSLESAVEEKENIEFALDEKPQIVVRSASLYAPSQANFNQDADSTQITDIQRNISVSASALYDHQENEAEPWWAMSHVISHGSLKTGSIDGTEEISGEICSYARSESDGVYNPQGKSQTTASGTLSIHTNGEQANLKVSAVYNSGCSNTNEHCEGNHTFDGANLTISAPNKNFALDFSKCKSGCGVNEEIKEQTIVVSNNDQVGFTSQIGGFTLGNGVLNGCIGIKIKIEPVK